jgi:3,4-dihydroxy-2-butanone 4-phosphate synthase
MIKDEYLKAVTSAGFEEVRVVDESSFPIESMANDPTAKAIAKNMNLTAKTVNELVSSVLSVKVSGIKPD